MSQKKRMILFFGNNSTLERARNKSRVVFLKIQEILYVIGTKIFQIDLLEAEKIGSKDGNSA